MTIGGWIFMILSVSFVVGLAAFCFYRVLTTPTCPSQAEAQPPSTAQQPDHRRPRKQTAG
jgi:hypothetical protein